MDRQVKILGEKMSQGMVPIDAVDKNGRELHQFEAVYCEGYSSLIIWSLLTEDYIAMNDEGGWLDRESMTNGERVLFTKEEDWGAINETASQLHEEAAESVQRLITSHHNMDALFNEVMRSLRKIAEETTDEATRDFANQKVNFIRSLVNKPDEKLI